MKLTYWTCLILWKVLFTGILSLNLSFLDTYQHYEQDTVEAHFTLDPQDEIAIGVTEDLGLEVYVREVTCPGEYNGEIIATASGGTPPYNFQLLDSNGFTILGASENSNFLNLEAGTYIVEVIDAVNSTFRIVTTLTEPETMSILLEIIEYDCVGLNSASVSGSVSGGNPDYEYSIDGNNFSVSQTFSDLAPGDYEYYVRDANGCTTVEAFIIPERELLKGSVIVHDNYCDPTTNDFIEVVASGGIPPYQYAIDGITFQSSNTFEISESGLYYIQILDSYGCTYGVEVQFDKTESFQLSASYTNYCTNDDPVNFTLSASGGHPPYEYRIDEGEWQSTNKFTTIKREEIKVESRDALGCVNFVNANLIPIDELTFSMESGGNLCYGENDGYIEIDVTGGMPPYSYSLNDGVAQADNLFQDLSPGTYEVIVSDGLGCQSIQEITLDKPEGIYLNISDIDYTNICIDETFDITLEAVGGDGSFSYQIDDEPAQSSATFKGLTTGKFRFAAIDSKGCSGQIYVYFDLPISIMGEVTINNVSCFGRSDGSVILKGIGGVPPYQYSLDGIEYQSEAAFNELPASEYTVFIKDNADCVFEKNIVITEPELLTLKVDQSEVSCFGTNDGSFMVDVNGGVAPYAYQINDEALQKSNKFTDLSAGIYTVRVVDDQGCFVEEEIIIGQPDALAATFTEIDNSRFCTDGTLSFMLQVSGGQEPYSYQMDDDPLKDSGDFTGVPYGNHVFKIIDKNGCELTINKSFIAPEILKVTTSVMVNSCFGENEAGILIEVVGGSPPYQYSIDGVLFQSNASFEDLNSGNYEIYVKDAKGCTLTTQVMIEDPDKLEVGFTVISPSCTFQADGSIQVDATGGTPPYQYSMDDFTYTENADFEDLGIGVYTVSVVDSKGCDAKLVVTLEQVEGDDFDKDGINDSCDEDIDGDGIANDNDLCPYTPLNTTVNDFGCEELKLPQDNFKIGVTDLSCRGSDNGSIQVNVEVISEYSAELYLEDNLIREDSFESSLLFDSLISGVYSLCLRSVELPNMELCYELVINEPLPLEVYAEVIDDQNLNLTLSGGKSYTIMFNELTYITDQKQISLPLKKGVNKLQVFSEKLCAGLYEREFMIEDRISVFPNPISGEILHVLLPSQINDTVLCILIDLKGNIISSFDVVAIFGELNVKIPELQRGMYVLRLETANGVFNKRIVKN
ncbi:T9SS type A sorting domain-containing protein [Robertkochia solimangrovi]|uniref:T9SS type A sorting domain-containing protein n=1 Tax=Robertkochia solimangrovi TaxID=2213046 RepID=UPI00117EB8BF|nr:T9SS type A sorting domain-containing protein [Robertkochia solimangrovi]TRZ44332.1 hypothetical protein DMZ48_07420 [Robertkochia solimangrovi]